MKKLLLIAFLSTVFLGTAIAGELYTVKGKTQGRVNHEMLYQDGCNSCHQGSPKANTTDAACVDCHGTVETIEIDESILAVPEAHPHKSLHYNQGASCLACHSEHQKKAPICADCHRTWFQEM